MTRAARRRTVVLLLAVGLVLVLAFQVLVVRSRIESRLEAAGQAGLSAAGLSDVTVTFDGRDGTLVGQVDAPADVAAATAAVSDVAGTRTVDAQALLVRPAVVAAGPTPEAPVTATAPSAAAPSMTAPQTTAPQTTAPQTTAPPMTAPSSQASDMPGSTLDLPPLTFADGAADLTAQSGRALQVLAERIMSAPPGRSFVIRTHTDGRGDAEANQRLSEQRAQAVSDALVAQGVELDRLSVVGVGEAEPLISPEVTEADREANRRVEVFALT